MARIFSINFDYEGITYTAMVTVRTTPFFTEYALRTEEDIESQLPGTKIISTSADNLVFANATFDHVTPLMTEIMEAVKLHVKMLTA